MLPAAEREPIGDPSDEEIHDLIAEFGGDFRKAIRALCGAGCCLSSRAGTLTRKNGLEQILSGPIVNQRLDDP